VPESGDEKHQRKKSQQKTTRKKEDRERFLCLSRGVRSGERELGLPPNCLSGRGEATFYSIKRGKGTTRGGDCQPLKERSVGMGRRSRRTQQKNGWGNSPFHEKNGEGERRENQGKDWLYTAVRTGSRRETEGGKKVAAVDKDNSQRFTKTVGRKQSEGRIRSCKGHLNLLISSKKEI